MAEGIYLINPRGRIVDFPKYLWEANKSNMIKEGYKIAKCVEIERKFEHDLSGGPLRIVIFAVLIKMGGAQRFAVDLAERLTDLGADVTLITMEPRFVGGNDNFFNFRGKLEYVKNDMDAIKLLDNISPDAIIWNEYTWKIARSWKNSRPVKIAWYHTEGNPNKLVDDPNINAHVFVDWPEGVPLPENAYFIPNAIDTKKFKPVRRLKKGANAKLTLGYLGRIDNNKLPLKSIKAIYANFRRTDKIVIYGAREGDPYVRKLKEACPDIEFHPPVPHDRVPAILQTFDIYLQLSNQEGCPLALLEAMACGLPIAAYSCPGVDRIDGLKTHKSIEALISYVKALKKSPRARLEAAKQARRATISTYAIPNHTSKVVRAVLGAVERFYAAIMLPIFDPPIELFKEVLENLQKQTFRKWVCYAHIDGGDYRTYLNILKSLNDPRFVISYTKANKGVAYARNVIWRKAENARILILQDADDPSDLNRIAEIIEFYDKHPEANIVTSQCRMGGSKAIWPNMDVIEFGDLMRQNYVPNPAASIRREKFKNLKNPWNSKWNGGEDYDLWLRLTKEGEKIHVINKPLVTHNSLKSGICAKRTAAEPDFAEKIRAQYHD